MLNTSKNLNDWVTGKSKMKMKKNKTIFITYNDIYDLKFGGGIVSNRNWRAMRELTNVDCFKVERKSSLRSLFSLLQFLFPPLDRNDIRIIKRMIKENKYEYMFLDSSLLGYIAKRFKKNTDMKIIVFLHNVETDYVFVRFGKSIRKYLYYLVAWFNERLSLKYSDKVITLTNRDSERINKLYGRKADYLIPATFKDNYAENHIPQNKEEYTCLFIGSFVRANYEGAKWLVKNVMPHVDARLIIAGKGFENVKDELSTKNVDVIGEVEDLNELYSSVNCVVLPIFSGAGMKLKTAEALMYGKTIFGTTEAFVGYDVDFKKIGGVCNSAEDFVQKLNAEIKNNDKSLFNKYCRNIFLSKYSDEASKKIFDQLLRE